jgi:hypothetical protein
MSVRTTAQNGDIVRAVMNAGLVQMLVASSVVLAACTLNGEGRTQAADEPGRVVDASPSPAAFGPDCVAGSAERQTCRFIAAVQSNRDLDNQEFLAAQDGTPLPEGPYRVEPCDYEDPAAVTCEVAFGQSSGVRFTLVARNAEYADGRLVLLEGTTAEYAVQSYRLS